MSDSSIPGFPIYHQLLDLAHTYVHWASDAIQSSHPLPPLLLLPAIFPSIRVFSNKSALQIRQPKYWSFSISPSKEYSGLISFRIDWFDLPFVQGILQARILKWKPFPSPGDLPDPGIKPGSPALQMLYCLSHQGSPYLTRCKSTRMDEKEFAYLLFFFICNFYVIVCIFFKAPI